jgi:hypothetical protein
MTQSRVFAKLRYKPLLAFFALFSIALFASCQNIAGGAPAPTLSPTNFVSATPIIRATFTHLPGDLYFLYQTETAAPTPFSTIVWQTPNVFTTLTPQYGLTETVIAVTKVVCVLAYPDFCISPNVRLGCTLLLDKGKHDFTVLPPDPYGYDKDGDGIGCETEKGGG